MEYIVRCTGCTKLSQLVGSKEEAEHLSRTHARAKGHTVSIAGIEVKTFLTIRPSKEPSHKEG